MLLLDRVEEIRGRRLLLAHIAEELLSLVDVVVGVVLVLLLDDLAGGVGADGKAGFADVQGDLLLGGTAAQFPIEKCSQYFCLFVCVCGYLKVRHDTYMCTLLSIVIGILQ